jgi:hypothetical protein
MQCERCNAKMEEKNEYEIYNDETEETEYYKEYICPKCDLSRTKRVFYLCIR